MKKGIICIIGLIIAVVSFANVTTQTVVVTGEGQTLESAVSTALVSAVGQVKGVDVSAVIQTLEGEQQTYQKKSINSNTKTINNEQYDSALQKDIKTVTKGVVNSYKIIRKEKKGASIEVTLKVALSVYEKATESGNSNQFKNIAIIPFTINSDVSTDQIGINSSSLGDLIENKLSDQFVQSRKFRVLSRSSENQSVYDKEKKLLKSDSVSPEEKSRLGQMLGADYVLTGKINDISLSEKKLNDYGMHYSKYTLSISLSYEVLEIATMQILWSNSVVISPDGSNLENQIRDMGKTGTVDYYINSSAKVIANQIILNIYPFQVMKISGKTVYLNQGGNRIKVGQSLNIKGKNSVVVDPANGTHIVIPGDTLATIKIIDVSDKYAVATLESGSLSKVKIGAIAK